MMVVCGDGIVGVESESSLRSGLDRVVTFWYFGILVESKLRDRKSVV